MALYTFPAHLLSAIVSEQSEIMNLHPQPQVAEKNFHVGGIQRHYCV